MRSSAEVRGSLRIYVLPRLSENVADKTSRLAVARSAALIGVLYSETTPFATSVQLVTAAALFVVILTGCVLQSAPVYSVKRLLRQTESLRAAEPSTSTLTIPPSVAKRPCCLPHPDGSSPAG